MKTRPFNKFRNMKFIIVCTALLISIAGKAQTWHFGPKLDVNYSAIKGDGLKSNFSPGWQIGGFAEIKFTSKWSIQPEVIYTWSRYQQASDFMVYYNNYGRSTAAKNINQAYITVPVLARFNLNKTLSFLAGPQFSYLVFDDEDLLKSDDQAFKNYEMSANVGAQVNLGNVGFYARYIKGLSNINNIDERYKWKSNHIQVGIAVAIR